MGKMLIDGQLRDKPSSKDGRFRRFDSGFRDWVSRDGTTEFPAEAGRYHLYISQACPWSHRTTIMRALKGLETVISITEMDAFMGDEGWRIDQTAFEENANVARDRFLYEVYLRAAPNYSGPITVPLLWDKQRQRIVSSESADILRMLNSAFTDFAEPSPDYYPPSLRTEIDRMNAVVYEAVNNGVYRAGFATTQEAYEEAIAKLFSTLGELDARLGHQRYLTGDVITEADWRLFTTLIRFDPVYVTHFKTDRRRIADYPHLGPYLRELYQVPGIAATVDLPHIRRHYFHSHRRLNPNGIIATGPPLDFTQPHGREALTPPASKPAEQAALRSANT